MPSTTAKKVRTMHGAPAGLAPSIESAPQKGKPRRKKKDRARRSLKWSK
jgi:hypothetical protein